jgi:predicted ATPase/DNA-binding XRE family transcriptional regulator
VAAGLTQEDLAERAGISRRGISDLERGARDRPWRETVQLLTAALGLTGEARSQFEAGARPARVLASVSVEAGSRADAATSRHNLPVQVTSFIGRQRELAQAREILSQTRLLTLTGTGGCGKTRLALKLGEQMVDEYPDGVWLVELAPLTDPSLIPQVIASAIAVRETAGRDLTSVVVAALRARRLLLILDNCEHLIDQCAKFADTVLRRCPQIHVLATSREALGIGGEVSWPVPSLAVPEADAIPSPAELSLNEAVGLFAERARLVRHGFTVTNQNAAPIVQICQQLDGIPLALELAAARLKGLSAERLASRLDQRFQLLTGGSRAAMPRQQTLAATIDWSYELLSEPERRLFQRLGVFVGGFNLDSAEAVGGGAEVLYLLLRLVEKSLVLVEPGEDGADRYRLLETLRQYALEKLAASGEAEAVHRRHQAHYFAQAEAAGREFWGSRMATWYSWLQRDLNNVRAALRWATDPGEVDRALRVCGALTSILYYQGHPSETRRWVDELLARSPPGSATVGRGRALISLGSLAWNQLDLDQADTFLDEALTILRQRDDHEGIAEALGWKAYVAIDRESYLVARALAEEAVTVLPPQHYSAFPIFHILGNAYFYLGDYPRARAAFEQDVSRRDSVEQWSNAANFYWLGNVATATGNYGEARRHYAESMRWRLQVDRKIGVAFTLSGLAGLAAAQGHLARSVRISSAAARLCELSGVPPQRTQQGYIRGKLPEIRETLGAVPYDAAWAEGRGMTLEQAVDYALRDGGPEG